MGKRRRPTTSGNFFKDVMRVLGFSGNPIRAKRAKVREK